MYGAGVPQIWTDTVETHRREVRDAILTTTWRLVVEHGLMAVTMSRIAAEAGIGRATLYKYFPDVEAILAAQHHQHISGHLARLAALRDQAADPVARLQAVLAGYAAICYHRHQHGTEELSALLHHSAEVAGAEQQLHDLMRDLLARAAADGAVRQDSSADELAAYCLHALAAAGSLPTPAAVERLVAITWTGLQPPA